MKRTLVVVAAVVGFATAASAATLTVFTTNSSNVAQDSFLVGDTILLKVTGDTQGGAATGAAIAQVDWDGSLTTTVVNPLTCTGSSTPGGPCIDAAQGNWYADKGSMALLDGSSAIINQQGARTATNVDTSFITLVADAIGVTAVTWGGTNLDFFGISSYNAGGISIPTGHSFSIVPEPATAGLIGLGLLGLVLGGRRRE